MKRVLLVDDDPVITRIYQVGLSRRGFQVESAADGLEAIKAIRAGTPDIVVLDLMMPRLSGIEVLRLIRKEPQWAGLPVVVFSNAYVDQATREAATLGAQKGLLKVGCTPLLLEKVLYEVLEGKPSGMEDSHLLVALKEERTAPPTPSAVTGPATPPRTGLPQQPLASETVASEGTELIEKTRREFLGNASRTCADLRALFDALRRASTDQARAIGLQDFYRKVHFITAGSGLAGCRQLGQMASAFEALLFGMLNKPSQSNPSLMRTAELIVDFFPELFRRAETAAGPELSAGVEALVVDDDPISARLAVAALAAAKLRSRSVGTGTEALQLLEQYRYDLVLLDVEMPNMNGFELCQRLRRLQAYAGTPVIFVTSHGGFETCAKSITSGGDDLIGKPFVPMELGAKAVMHLLKAEPKRGISPVGPARERQTTLVPNPLAS